MLYLVIFIPIIAPFKSKSYNFSSHKDLLIFPLAYLLAYLFGTI